MVFGEIMLKNIYLGFSRITRFETLFINAITIIFKKINSKSTQIFCYQLEYVQNSLGLSAEDS
jgi:hypothetical protein